VLKDAVVQAIQEKVSLSGANLSRANLSGANLSGALPTLYILKTQTATTKLRAWKYLYSGKSPYKGFPYEVGKTYTFDEYCEDERESCAAGGNVATLPWCLNDSRSGCDCELIEVEFLASDIVSIPFATDGKFRVKKLTVLRKLTRDEALAYLSTLIGTSD
jgi:hypothetical protein